MKNLDNGSYLRMKQGTEVSTANSSTATIASGAYFTGAAEDAIDINGIQTIVKSEQPITMYIDQSIDSSNWDIVDSWPVASGVGDARTVASVAPYFRVRAKNEGSFTTQYFRLATGKTPFIESMPRALVQHGLSSAGLSVASRQDVIASTLNSSTDNISASSTWTGSSETTLGVAGIQINIKTDQNCTVYVDQSTDGTNWDITDEYEYLYSLGGASWTVQATASYFRVRVKNLSTTTATSYFRFQTALCPVVEALPRSLDNHGHLKTCVETIHGTFDDHSAVISPMGAQKVSTTTRLVGSTFIGSVVDDNFWQSTSTSTGTSNVSGGTMTLSTGVTANAGVLVKSVRIARYLAACSNYYRGNVRLPVVTTTVGTNTRRFGAFDEDNGYFFEVNQAQGSSTSVLRCVCRKDTSDSNYVQSGSFNGDYGTTYILDNNVHTYEIHWTNRNAFFVIDDNIIHTFTGSTSTLVSTPSLKIGLQCVNAGGNTANNTLAVRSSTINRLGDVVSQPQWANISVNASGVPLKVGPGNLHSVAVNTPGDSLNALTLYDGTSIIGSKIATITTDVSNNTTTPSTLDFKNLPFASGLYYSLATGTAGNYTVIYE